MCDIYHRDPCYDDMCDPDCDPNALRDVCAKSLDYICVSLCVCECVCVCVYTYTCVCVCVCVCVYIHTYYMCVHIYIISHTGTNKLKMYNEKFGEERVKMMMPRMTEAFAKVRA